MKSIIIENGEEIIGNWTLNCVPFNGRRSLGKLYITKDNLYFESKFDSSLSGIIENVVVTTIASEGHALLVGPEIAKQWEEKGYLQIAKKDIAKIEEKSSLFKKTVNLSFSDNSQVVFDYGMLGIKKLVAAIKQ
jgi:hypothetical protein